MRELRNLVEQAAVLVKGELIEPADLALSSIGREAEAAPERLRLAGERPADRRARARHAAPGARALVLERDRGRTPARPQPRDTVRYRLQKYGLRPP
ncbi:MAG: hypothetical protein U1E17_09395 [Geminicoccaceae bacterium]